MNEESIIIVGFSESNWRKNLVGRKDKKEICLAKPDHIKARAVCFQSVMVASTFGEILRGFNDLIMEKNIVKYRTVEEENHRLCYVFLCSVLCTTRYLRKLISLAYSVSRCL